MEFRARNVRTRAREGSEPAAFQADQGPSVNGGCAILDVPIVPTSGPSGIAPASCSTLQERPPTAAAQGERNGWGNMVWQGVGTSGLCRRLPHMPLVIVAVLCARPPRRQSLQREPHAYNLKFIGG